MAEIGPDTDISASVGRKGVNRPEDVARVKGFLNAISTEEGGTDGTLDESDTSGAGSEFEALVTAIITFQRMNFAGLFTPDGLVEKRRNTHKALVNKSHRGLMHVDPIDSGGRFIPAAGLVLDTDGRGFSRAGLIQNGATGDWTQKNAGADPIQMIPVGGSRTLVMSSIAASTFTFEIVPNSITAAIVDSSKTHATVVGVMPGEAQLRAIGYFGNVAATATLRVRAKSTVRVRTVHVGRPRQPGAENNFAKLLPSISRLYEPQTNLSFALDSTSVMEKLGGVDVDPSKPVTAHPYLGMSREMLRDLGIEQPFSPTEMAHLYTDTSVLTIFFSDRMVEFNHPATLGAAHGAGGHVAWFRIGTGSNLFAVPAHEIGHLLGYHHITAPFSETYLMNTHARLNNMRIPSDTLTELRF
jgi:hypothetical protein